MSSAVEFKGKTVEKAVENACRKLDLDPEQLQFDVVSRGATGIFGIVGVKKACIKVYLQEKQIDIPKESLAATNPVREDRPENSPVLEMTDAVLAGQEALERIVNSITSGSRILVEENKKRIFYNISGGNAGRLIGKRGQTLEAINYLVEKIVNRTCRERVRVDIDVSGYRDKKRQNLESLAARTAQKAKKNGKPATLGQLNAHDRRIIHLALKNDREVSTRSVGNGFLRKLIVIPKKRNGGPKKRSPNTSA